MKSTVDILQSIIGWTLFSVVAAVVDEVAHQLLVVVVEEVGATESATSVTASTARRVHASQPAIPLLL